VLSKYRKVNPWIPWELHASPHDIRDYAADPFPVVDTEIGRLGVAICYDWLFPEAIRQIAFNGAEVIIRVSAYMDPWGATPPMDWWTLFNRARAVENTAYVVAANQGASLRNYPPFSWPGGSMLVDFDGRILAQADPGPGEKVVVAPVDIGALRAERERRSGHDMRAHLRSEMYPYLRQGRLPPAAEHPITSEQMGRRIREAKGRVR
jgi:predicted amidohydrolase